MLLPTALVEGAGESLMLMPLPRALSLLSSFRGALPPQCHQLPLFLLLRKLARCRVSCQSGAPCFQEWKVEPSPGAGAGEEVLGRQQWSDPTFHILSSWLQPCTHLTRLPQANASQTWTSIRTTQPWTAPESPAGGIFN